MIDKGENDSIKTWVRLVLLCASMKQAWWSHSGILIQCAMPNPALEPMPCSLVSLKSDVEASPSLVTQT
jgi:hypothetical protein